MNRVRSIALAVGLLASLPLAHAVPQDDTSWRFDVYLNDDKIGIHEYRLERRDDGLLELEANARFDVRFLFINAFRYRHNARELWQGDCLTGIEASTNSNGSKTRVEGQLTERGFEIAGDGSESLLDRCVMTFAYWNPAFLEQSKLLNPQTGEFVDVEVEALGEDTVRLGDRRVAADSYRIKARDVEVTVWYSADNEWLALESPAKGGRVLRYERQS